MTSFQSEFISQCIFRIDENPPKIKRCVDLLTKSQVWQKPGNSFISIGNLVLHLCGNARHYAISSLENLLDTRQRNQEFKLEGGFNKAALLFKFTKTLEDAKVLIQEIKDPDWLK